MAPELIIVGVGHVFDISQKIEKIIMEEEPDAVAVELDGARAKVLIEGKGKGKSPNIFYSMLSKIQERISKKFGGKTGREMLAAIHTSWDRGISVYYIDMDANIIISKLWKSISLGKKFYLLFSSILSLFLSKERIEKEVKNFEKSPDDFMEEMEREFPQFKKILIDGRNEYMARKLEEILSLNNKVVVVVGEGHVKGIKDFLGDKEIKIREIHLSELL